MEDDYSRLALGLASPTTKPKRVSNDSVDLDDMVDVRDVVKLGHTAPANKPVRILRRVATKNFRQQNSAEKNILASKHTT